MDKEFVFIKDYTCSHGTIPQGTSLVRFRGFLYMNGGICMPAYTSILNHIIDDDKLHKEYLKDVPLQKNTF
jgi:hypothetical protein